MEKNIVLAGVGGQGILSIAYVFDNAALDAGYHFKQAEVHGMAQRCGAVQSTLRYADHPIHSDLVPRGKADLILSVEPLEALRYLEYLAPEGAVVTSTTPYTNVADYPALDVLLAQVARLPNVVLIDSRRVASAAGNLRGQNMVMAGAASPLLDFTSEQLLKHVRGLFARKGPEVQAQNVRAFEAGRAVGLFYRGLVDAGVVPLAALDICTRVGPARCALESPRAWAAAQAAGKLDELFAAAAVNA